MVCSHVHLNLARVVPLPYSPLPVWRNTSKGIAVKCVPHAKGHGGLGPTYSYSLLLQPHWLKATSLFLLVFLSLFLASYKYIRAKNKTATA